MKNHLLSLTCLAVALLGPNVSAIQVQFDFSGLVTGVQPNSRGETLGCDVGQPYSVSFVYDSTLPDKDESANVGYFNSPFDPAHGPTAVSDTSLGGHLYRGGFAGVNIRQVWTENGPTDSFKVEIEGPNSSYCRFLLTDSTGLALGSGDAMPETLCTGDWDSGQFEWDDRFGTRVMGSILGLRQPVPDNIGVFDVVFTGLAFAAMVFINSPVRSQGEI